MNRRKWQAIKQWEFYVQNLDVKHVECGGFAASAPSPSLPNPLSSRQLRRLISACPSNFLTLVLHCVWYTNVNNSMNVVAVNADSTWHCHKQNPVIWCTIHQFINNFFPLMFGVLCMILAKKPVFGKGFSWRREVLFFTHFIGEVQKAVGDSFQVSIDQGKRHI